MVFALSWGGSQRSERLLGEKSKETIGPVARLKTYLEVARRMQATMLWCCRGQRLHVFSSPFRVHRGVPSDGTARIHAKLVQDTVFQFRVKNNWFGLFGTLTSSGILCTIGASVDAVVRYSAQIASSRSFCLAFTAWDYMPRVTWHSAGCGQNPHC